MQSCGCGGKSCNGIVQKSDPRKVVNGVVYKLHCFNKEKQDASPIPEKPRGNNSVLPK